MQEQKDRAKAATAKISVTGDMKYAKLEDEVGSTEFVGYEENECDAKILATIEGDGYIDVVLNKTPFYAECGGQTGDSGIIEDKKTNGQEVKLEVLTTFKVNKLFVHRCKIINGDELKDVEVHAQIDIPRREEIRLHHTSAHLLQSALRKVLGEEVHQAGSQVEQDRMRFDFTFSRAMTPEEIFKVEEIMNNWVAKGLNVHTDIMDIEQAKLTGATALFGEKYDDIVRVVSIGNETCISKEFCAGTHARNTRDLRLVKIVTEGAIAAGTRRIELVVSKAAFEYMNAKVKEMDKLSLMFKTHFDGVVERVEKLQEENKELQKELTHVKEENARAKFATFLSKAQDIEGGKLFITKIEDIDGNALKTGIEFVSQKLGESIIVLASAKTVAVKVSDSFVKKGVNAGKIVGEIARFTGANGGGRPNFAQGGIKDASKLDEILAKVEAELQSVKV